VSAIRRFIAEARHLVTAFFVFTLLNAPAFTQQATEQGQPLPADIVASFDKLLETIRYDEEEINRLIIRQIEPDPESESDTERVVAEILMARIDRTGVAMFQNVLALARQLPQQRDEGYDVSAYEAAVVENLLLLPAAVDSALMRYRDRIEFPTGKMPPQEFVYKDQMLFKILGEADEIYQIVIDYIAVSDDLGLDSSTEAEYIVQMLSDSAANRSIYLELAIDDVAALQSSVATLPNNAELGEWYNASQARVQATAVALQRIITLLEAVGIETRVYRRQVLGVTGELTTAVLEFGIVANIAKEWGGALLDVVIAEGPKWLLKLILIALILFIFVQLGKLAQNLVRRGLNSARVRISYLLKEMITSSIKNLVILFGILIAISQLGISLGPLLAGLGIAGFIIGFALQDSLSNFASGMLILLYRPFDVGDVVSSGGVTGRVSAMSLVNTTFLTLDNQKLVVPNNLIWQSVITNVTAQRTRRIDLLFGIAYSDDVEKAQKILEDILEKYEAILDDPEPVVRVHELGESSVNFTVRPWVKTKDYWETYWAITKEVKLQFDKEGISIPFPQRDVHLFEQKAD